MSILYTVQKNNYHKHSKNSTVYTPEQVSLYLHHILKPYLQPKVILDPAIGRGSLTNPWRNKKCHVIGMDIDKRGKDYCDAFIHGKFEEIQKWNNRAPQLILCNPPFNGAPKRKLYPEVFLRQIVYLFGNQIPIVMIAPIGMRLNIRTGSDRWIWMRDTLKITSIVSLPIDCFGVKFHTEILIFNVPGLDPHYYLYQ